MDGKITSARLNAERNVGRAVSMMQSVNKLFSAYENVEDITNDISALADGSKQLSDLKIFQDALNDSTARNNLNANITELSKDVNKLKEVASQFTSVSSDPNAQAADSALQSASSDSTLQKQIDELGPAVAFYKIADGFDNDGDGCVDEEIYDSKDNDGDGFTDEDIRGTLMTANDLKDNDLDGQIDEADELFALDGTLLFTQSPSYVVGPKYTDKSTKVAYSVDTTFATYSISTRKTQLGACWK
jgi:hypothetical protein